MEFLSVSFEASSRRHGVSRWQVLDVVRAAAVALHVPARRPSRPDDGLLFLGDDRDGRALEIVGVVSIDGRRRIIHAMPLRRRYRGIYEEVKRWDAGGSPL